MKTTITTILLALSLFSWGQFVEDFTKEGSLIAQKINKQDYIIYRLDFENNNCILYYTDYTVRKTIKLPVPDGYYLADMGLVAEKLFNTDDLIELVCVFYKYTEATETAEGYYTYKTSIIDENGKDLLTVDGARYAYVKECGKNDYRLFVYSYDYSIWPYKIWTTIYNIGGDKEEIKDIFFSEDDYLKSLEIAALYPVPADNSITIDYSLNSTTNIVNINISDSKGTIIDTKQLESTSSKLTLDCSNYPAGVYSYTIEDDFSVLQSGSFTVIHNN